MIANWYVTGKNSDKISKSKGGAQPIPGAAAKYGVDALRLYYAHVASMFVDVEWDEGVVATYRQRLDRTVAAAQGLIGMELEPGEGPMGAWLGSRFETHVRRIREAMESYDLRQMAAVAFFDMPSDFRWYVRRGGKSSEAVRNALRTWIQAMAPVTPHVAEHLWELAGFEGLVSASLLPEADPSKESASAEYGEDLVREVISDVAEVRRIAGKDPSRILIYTAAAWKREVMSRALAMLRDGTLSVPALAGACMTDEAIRRNGKAASDLARKVAEEFPRSAPEAKQAVVDTDEFALLSAAAGFLSDETGLEVSVLSEDAEGLYDPKGKAGRSLPGKPAIYIE